MFVLELKDVTSYILELMLEVSTLDKVYVINPDLYSMLRKQSDIKVDMAYIKGNRIYGVDGGLLDIPVVIKDTSLIEKYGVYSNDVLFCKKHKILNLEVE